ncbi:MAG: hypothetical protein GX556_14715 [Fibrobacter sp.]|nr:hypothetical protein [Fibrobacter sp.]
MFSSKLKSVSGISLMELTVAMVVGSIVVSAALQSQRYFMKGMSRENEKAQIQRDIITVSDLLEKDIRMSGFGLPGNGIKTVPSEVTSDELFIYTNSDRLQTELATDAASGSDRIYVNDAQVIMQENWICLKETDTAYLEITGTGISGGGPDTVYLAATLPKTYTASATTVYPAGCIYWHIENDSSCYLTRKNNGLEVKLSAMLDTMNITPKDDLGTAVNQISSARVLTVMFGGKVGSGPSAVLMAESTEVNIRNRL